MYKEWLHTYFHHWFSLYILKVYYTVRDYYYTVKDYNAYSNSTQHLHKQKGISVTFAIGPLETPRQQAVPKLFTFQQSAGQTRQLQRAKYFKIFICCLKF